MISNFVGAAVPAPAVASEAAAERRGEPDDAFRRWPR